MTTERCQGSLSGPSRNVLREFAGARDRGERERPAFGRIPPGFPAKNNVNFSQKVPEIESPKSTFRFPTTSEKTRARRGLKGWVSTLKDLTTALTMSLQITETAILEGVRWDAETRRGSVLDVIRLVTESDARYASKTFARITEAYPSVVRTSVDIEDGLPTESNIGSFQFSGERQRSTPVAPLKTLVEIAWLLPGRRAAEFRRAGAATMCRVLGGDLSLVDEIRERHGALGPEERAAWLEGVEIGTNVAQDASVSLRRIAEAVRVYEVAKENLGEKDRLVLSDVTTNFVKQLAEASLTDRVSNPRPEATRSGLLPVAEDAASDDDRGTPLTRAPIVARAFDAYVTSDRFSFGPLAYIPMKAFQRGLKAFAERRGLGWLSKRDVSPANLDPHPARRGLVRRVDAMPYGGSERRREFVIGIDAWA